MTDFFKEQMFSNRYLCAKYILKMMSLYIDVAQLDKLDVSCFFKLSGMMHIEFFSMRTIYQDKEALQASASLIEIVGRERLQ